MNRNTRAIHATRGGVRNKRQVILAGIFINRLKVKKLNNMTTEAIVKTEFGALYLKKLCRHFAHKIPATISGSQGRIEFPFGPCRINVNDEQMHLHIEVDDAAEMDRAEQVVAEHLIRMANKDEPTVKWIRNNPALENTAI